MVDYRYYLGPWIWTNDGESPAGWRAPEGTVGLVDLATVGEQSEEESAAGSLRRIGFFATVTDLGSEYALLGRGDCRELAVTGTMREAWESESGFRPAGDWLVDLLWDQLTSGSDPVGGIAVKPLLPVADRLELHLGGHSLVKRQPFDLDSHPHRGRVLDTLRLDFVELFEAAQAGRVTDTDHPRRVLDFWCVRFGTDDWRQFVPPRLRAHIPGRLPHATTQSDNFNRTAGNLDGSTASGGGTWAEPEGTAWETDGSVARVSSMSNDDYAARLESDLSGSHHECQFDITAATSGGRGGPTVRHSASAQTMYYLYCRADQNDFSWWKQVAGTHTQIGATTGFTFSLPDTIRLRANGSTLEAILNGASQGSVTDTAISGNLRCGMYCFVTNFHVDNWSAADLSLTATAPAASLVTSGVAPSGRKSVTASPGTAPLAGLGPTSRKLVTVTPTPVTLSPVMSHTRKLVAVPPAGLSWLAQPPVGGMTATVTPALMSLGTSPFAVAKQAAVPIGSVSLSIAMPAPRKHASLGPAVIPLSPTTPSAAKTTTVSVAPTAFTGREIVAVKRAALPPTFVVLQPSAPVARKMATLGAAAAAVSPSTPTTRKRTSVPAASASLTSPTTATAKRAAVPCNVLHLLSPAPATQKRPMLGSASLAVSATLTGTAKWSRLPPAIVDYVTILPATGKRTAVAPALVSLLQSATFLRKQVRLDPAALVLSARLWDQVQLWETFRFGRRGTVFDYQAPGTVFRFGKRRTVFHFRDR